MKCRNTGLHDILNSVIIGMYLVFLWTWKDEMRGYAACTGETNKWKQNFG